MLIGLKFQIVPEDPAVLESLLRSNPAIAKGHSSDSEMIASLEKVSLACLLHRPTGLGQLLGGFGAQFSGGKRQRLALARFLLAGFGTVILDELTASLDRDTSAEVMVAVFAAFSDKQVVVITHSSALLGLFDQVITLKAARA
ncbi:MAG: ATP-binding cassette domain-containing protein [Actinomycetota bacterium]|nr:MAG: ATP-binding cassette domain-containing protein [Actinomycetota bacterium]